MEQHSGMPSKGQLAGKSAPGNKAISQAHSNSTKGGFPWKKSMYKREVQV